MHKDFHLFGTYLLAYNAGFSNEDAKIIAFAAQAVDDFTEEVHPRHHTCQSNSKIAASLALKSDECLVADTWIPFHFLPCNVDERTFVPNYKTGKKELPGEPYNPEDKNFGVLYDAVANNLVANYDKDNASYLSKIGVVMHVLADTFAHQGFTGKFDNTNVVKNAYITMNDGAKVYLTLTGAMQHVPTFLPKIFKQFALGHGTIGHLPDISWAYYNFTVQKTGMVYTHDNRYIFADAFCNLSELLSKMVKPPIFVNHREILVDILKNVYKQISDMYKGKYTIALDTQMDQTFALALTLNHLNFDPKPPVTAVELESEYYDYYLKGLKSHRGDYYTNFLDAAVWHRNFVEKNINQYQEDYPLLYV